jgi:hypothetical protein
MREKTMTQTEALRLALEALEYFSDTSPNMAGKAHAEDAITAIKAALEAKDEPVAWLNPYGGVLQRLDTGLEKLTYTIPLYTTPPQRKPLTDEEMKAVVEQELVNYWDGEYIDTTGARDCLTKFARAIEAAHSIKGEA